jgi:hypothetical protein
MYWIYLALFVLAIFVPDIVKDGTYPFPHERLEEFLIFSFGVVGFLIFLVKENQISIKEFEGKKIINKLFRTNRELEDSYTYIGEVNRKLEILVHAGLGLVKLGRRTKTKEREAYDSVLGSAVALLKGKNAILRFVNAESNKTQKAMFLVNDCQAIKNEEFLEMGEDVHIKKGANYIIASSLKDVGGIKCYLIVEGYNESDDLDVGNNHNHEILKLLASHALFLYA